MGNLTRTTTLKNKTLDDCADDFLEDLFDPDCEDVNGGDERGSCSSLDVPICLGCLVSVDKCICNKKAEDFLCRHNP